MQTASAEAQPTEQPAAICPSCGSNKTTALYQLDAIPVQSCILLDTAEEGRAFPQHELNLCFCDGCGFIFNATFDEALVNYAATTEESQGFSGTFNSFAKQLIDEIVSRYTLSDKRVLEIGCGKGDFLQGLCEASGALGLGVDPGFIPERLQLTDGGSIDFRKEYFDPKTVPQAPDFVVCRHTLEHIAPVGAFVRDIKTTIGNDREVGIFFETPDMMRILEEGAYWDIYFEHCSYFTAGSHARLFRQEGLTVTDLYLAYGDQYIIQYAEANGRASGVPLDLEMDLDRARGLAEAFPGRVREVQAYWHDFVETRRAKGKRIAIWGGGSKGVSFLTSTGLGTAVDQVVDVNPFKQGKFLPGTGHLVVAPESLPEAPPDVVIIMNPIYLDEIGSHLHRLGLNPELVAV